MRQLLLQQDVPDFKDIEVFLALFEGKSTTPKEKCMKCEGWSEFLHLAPQRQNAFKAGFFLCAQLQYIVVCYFFRQLIKILSAISKKNIISAL